MAVFALRQELVFPPVHMSEPDGLLAIGGDLSQERLLLAYRNGIFPWYEGNTPMWWSPDPRFVLFPEMLKVSNSMKQVLRKKNFRFTINHNFAAVIHHCKTVRRQGQQGTWITDEVEKAYIRLHESGYAHSAEAWVDGQLAGGLYGIKMGRMFFGESMFSTAANTSKYAFILYVQHLMQEGIGLIDCQVYTPHLESLGANMIPREEFVQRLQQLLPSAG